MVYDRSSIYRLINDKLVTRGALFGNNILKLVKFSMVSGLTENDVANVYVQHSLFSTLLGT